MTLERGHISSSQLIFTIACYIQGSSLLTTFLVGIAKNNTIWAILCGFLIFLPFLFVLISLMKQYPGKNIVQINRLVFGKVIGSIVSLFYLYFFVTLCSLHLRDLADFTKSSILVDNPFITILIPFLLVCVLAVRAGGETITRFSTVFSLFFVVGMLALSLLLTSRMKVSNLFPMFTLPLKNYVQGSHVVMTIPFGELICFSMVAPMVKEYGKIRKSLLVGSIIGAVSLVFVQLVDIMTLGNTITLFTVPTYESMCLVGKEGDPLRLEVIFGIMLILLMFLKASLLLYASAITLAEIIRADSYRPLVFPLSSIVLIYSIIVYPNVMIHLDSAQQFVPFEWLFFEFFLPLITLIVMKLKKHFSATKESIQMMREEGV